MSLSRGSLAFGRGRTGILIALGAIVVAACAPPGENQTAGSEGPIKVGLLAPTTGVVAAAGTDMVNGWNLYWKVNGEEVAGRKIETIHEDTAGDPQTGLTKVRKLVDQDGVAVVAGPLLANVGYAIAEYLETQPNVVGLNPVASADDLSQRQPVDNYVRAGGWQSSSPHHVAGDWAADQGYKRVATLCQDYAFGHEVCGGFINAFTDRGGQVVKKLWAPLGSSDYSSYLAQINPNQVDAVFLITVGADSGRVIKQWQDFGLKGRVPLIAGETTLEQSLLRTMGDEAVGLQSFGHYAEGRQAPGTAEFVKAYQGEYDDYPSYYACATYTAAQWFSNALEESGGDMTDVDSFLQDLNSVTLQDSCLGPMKLDEHGGTIATMYLRKVVKDSEGNLINRPVQEFPNVSQFWNYEPEAFLDQPVYSRGYLGEDWPTSCASFARDCPDAG
jgi:branched-chain amino acid transport system substrate-binding protein